MPCMLYHLTWVFITAHLPDVRVQKDSSPYPNAVKVMYETISEFTLNSDSKEGWH